MRPQHRRSCFLRRILAGSVALALLGSVAVPAMAGKPDKEKVMRQIGIMEKILDKVLLDSPFLLVHSGDNSRGLYIDEFGAIFTFDASLTSREFDFESYLGNLPERFELKTDEDGNQVIVIKKHDEAVAGGQDKDSAKAKAKAKAKGKGKAGGVATEDEILSDRASRYEGAKLELMNALMDYGETMSTLQNGQYVMIGAFMKQDEFMKANRISRLLIKAKIDDLRAYTQGDIDEDTLRSRIEIEEY
jgi:hypothetical protein